jgi:hypothetical protein
MQEAYVQLIIALISGGILVKVWDRLFLSKKDQNEVMILLIEQLQRNVNENNEKLKLLEAEVEKWKNKYYDELEAKNSINHELRKLKTELAKFNNNNNNG